MPAVATISPGKAENGGARSTAVPAGPYNPLKQIVPLRADPTRADKGDSQRSSFFTNEYQMQTNVLLVRDRQIEYNVRMLCGQQWNVWHQSLGRFFDISEWLSPEEKAWRKLPVINKLLRWYVITHARLTENPPILTMLPGPDRVDAMLAEVLDTLVKKDWRDAGMDAVHDELMMWLVVAGRGYAVSRIDQNLGEWRPWVADSPVMLAGPDGLPIIGPDGRPAMSPEPFPNVPLSPDGSPNAMLMADSGELIMGEPHFERSGGIGVDVYSPLQVRGQWGPQLWHRKQWHTVQRFLTPEQVYEWTGVEVEPDLADQSMANVALLERVLFGSGFYGSALGRQGTSWVDNSVKGPLCTVYQRWQAPLPYQQRLEGTWAEAMIQTPKHAGGRETIWTPTAVLYDGPRKVAWPNVSPVRCFDFVRLPGRPSGTTPLEMLNGPQRAYNASRQQVMEQGALLGNPQVIVDKGFGLQPNQITNEPGKIYTGTKRPGIKSFEYLEAPPVTADVIKNIEFSANEIDELGGLRGTEGAPPTEDASGELVKELRFNADRLLGATARRNVGEYGRMGDDWRTLYPLIYDQETIIAVNGEDRLAETLTVLPMVFKEGHVDIVPDVESMLPEGRGERQARSYRLWRDGFWGAPDSEAAREIYAEQARFPHYSRLSRPGGIDREMARQENGMILSGQLAQPVYEWYDHMIHLTEHERYMKSPEFRKQPKVVQMAFDVHRRLHLMYLKMMMAAMAPPAPALGPGGPAGAPGGGPAGPGGGGGFDKPPAPTGAAEAAPPKSVSATGARSPMSPSRPEA